MTPGEKRAYQRGVNRATARNHDRMQKLIRIARQYRERESSDYDRPALFDRDEGEILAAISQKYRGDHNIETLFVILTRVAFERLQLLEALKGLIEASGGMAPVGAESKYETAMERAEAAIAKVRV